jgi:hypothetical protein
MLTCLTAPALVELLYVRTVMRWRLSFGMLLLGSYTEIFTCKPAWAGASKFKLCYSIWFVV